jgi:hypothetical protein
MRARLTAASLCREWATTNYALGLNCFSYAAAPLHDCTSGNCRLFCVRLMSKAKPSVSAPSSALFGSLRPNPVEFDGIAFTSTRPQCHEQSQEIHD